MGVPLQFDLIWSYNSKRGHDELFNEAVLTLRKGLEDYTPAFHAVAEDILAGFIREQFASEGAEAGVPWQQLAPATVRRRGSAHPILRVGGVLEDSFMKSGGGHREEIEPLRMAWGSTVPYAVTGLTAASANTVPHGLPRPPRAVLLVPGASGLWGETQAADGTNIYVTVGSGGATAGTAYIFY